MRTDIHHALIANTYWPRWSTAQNTILYRYVDDVEYNNKRCF